MSLANDNIVFQYRNGNKSLSIERSPLRYDQRRRFGNRLRRLYAYLGSIKPSQYYHDALVRALPGPTAPACGTVACAFGHAVTSGKFKDIPAKATVKRGSRPDYKGLFREGDIKYTYLKRDVVKQLKAGGFNPADEFIDMETAADSYFGPGAWDNIFDVSAYGYKAGNRGTLGNVRKRIKAIAEKHYGIKVE